MKISVLHSHHWILIQEKENETQNCKHTLTLSSMEVGEGGDTVRSPLVILHQKRSSGNPYLKILDFPTFVADALMKKHGQNCFTPPPSLGARFKHPIKKTVMIFFIY